VTARVTLISGKDEFLRARELRRVLAGLDPDIVRASVDAADESQVAALRDAVAPTLFGGGTVVVVDEVQDADEAMAAAITDALGDGVEDAWLVFLHAGGVKGKRIVDAIKAAGAEVIALPELKPPAFVDAEFRSHRRAATPEAKAAILEAVGDHLGLLAAAVSQLCSDLEADPIDAEHVREYYGGLADVPAYLIADAVWDRRPAEAIGLLRRLMVAERSSSGPWVVSSLSAGLRSTVRVGSMPPGADRNAVAREAGVPEWKVDGLRRRWSRWDQRRLAEAVVELGDADAAAKGGVREDEALDEAQKGWFVEALVGRLAGRAADESGDGEDNEQGRHRDR
jgi:DNA polymerase-3 subunit delta